MNLHHGDIVNLIKDSGYSVTLTIGPPLGLYMRDSVLRFVFSNKFVWVSKFIHSFIKSVLALPFIWQILLLIPKSGKIRNLHITSNKEPFKKIVHFALPNETKLETAE